MASVVMRVPRELAPEFREAIKLFNQQQQASKTAIAKEISRQVVQKLKLAA